MSTRKQPPDIDLARRILLYLDGSRSFPVLMTSIDDFSNEETSQQINLLNQAGMINAEMIPVESSETEWSISEITERGNYFLRLLYDETTWARIKESDGDRVLDFDDIEQIAHRLNEKIGSDVESENFNPKQQTVLAEKPEIEYITSPPFVPVNNPNVYTSPPQRAQTTSAAEWQSTGASSIVSPMLPEINTTDLPPTVQMRHIGDQPTADDKLGFKPYVEAIAKFLTDENTKGPLTLSVEGEWGSGKSSFMLQVENELKSIDKEMKKNGDETGKNYSNIFTVQFNAWRYDKEDALWAAFATQVVKQLKEKTGWRKRSKATWQLFWRRFDLKKGWLSLISFTLVIIALVFLVIMTIGGYVNNPSQAPGSNGFEGLLGKDGLAALIKFLTLFSAGYIILYILAFNKIKELLINPLSTDLKKHILMPDYKQRATFLDEFHDDFNKIIEAYAGAGDDAAKVFVFIDDLDRCEVPKSAELMQALNLMLSGMPQLFFIIGMDREKVAAGLAVKHEKLLGYLSPLPKNIESNTNPGLEFGFEFIEKFIQVPFKVPQPRANDIGKLIIELSAGKKQEVDVSPPLTKLAERWPRPFSQTSASTNINEVRTQPQPPIPPKPPKQEDVDSSEVGEVIQTVAPFFDYNPRRIKQFLNIYRLKIYIGNETGLFNHPPTSSSYKRINLYILGRFVALSLRYPLLIAELEDNPQLLNELQRYALNDISSNEVSSPYWLSKPRLLHLLKMNLEDIENRDSNKYALSNININQLLQVSPATKVSPTNAVQNLRTITSP